MKKLSVLFVSLVLMLLCGCGGLPETGIYGNIDTCSMAAEREGILYFLDPVGCVEENTGISAYDTVTGEYRSVVALKDIDIAGFQLGEKEIYVQSEYAVYAVKDGAERLLYQETEENYTVDWIILLNDWIYLSRSALWRDENEDIVEQMQILKLSVKNGKSTVVAELDDLLFCYGFTTCYYDGSIYSRGNHGEIFSLDLETGEVETQMAPDFVPEIFTTEEGVVYTMAGESGLAAWYLDGREYASEVEGYLLGGSREKQYLFNAHYLSGEIYALSQGACTLICDGFEWDMVTEPVGFAAGDYVLFYSPEALTEDAKDESMYHNLYLLSCVTGTVTCIGGYVQDYTYS